MEGIGRGCVRVKWVQLTKEVGNESRGALEKLCVHARQKAAAEGASWWWGGKGVACGRCVHLSLPNELIRFGIKLSIIEIRQARTGCDMHAHAQDAEWRQFPSPSPCPCPCHVMLWILAQLHLHPYQANGASYEAGGASRPATVPVPAVPAPLPRWVPYSPLSSSSSSLLCSVHVFCPLVANSLFFKIFIQVLQVETKVDSQFFLLCFFPSLFFNYYCLGSGHTHTHTRKSFFNIAQSRGSLAQFMALTVSLPLPPILSPSRSRWVVDIFLICVS